MRRLLALVLVLGCERPAGPPAETRPFTDSRGMTVRVPHPPRRIVSIAPSTTELLFAVGAGEQVAGVTTYCDWPAGAKAKPKVGDIVVDAERLAALAPDLVLTAYAVTRQTTADLESRGHVVFAVDPRTFEEIASALALLGGITGHAEEGARAAEALRARVGAVRPAPGPTFYFEHSAHPLGTTGPETYAGEALRRAGGRNVFDGGWRTVEWESVVARDPEVILIAHDRREGLERRAGWRDLKAVRAGRVRFVPKEHFVYPTPRLADGLETAAGIFHEKSP